MRANEPFMSLEHYQLTPFIITELYRNVLIDNELHQPVSDKNASLPFSYLGKNEKNILIIVSEKEATFLPDDMLQFLVGILSACKLSLADVALTNETVNPGLDYQKLQDIFKPRVIIFFGVDPVTLSFPLSFPQYQLQSYNRQTYLSAPSLQILANNIDEKKKLWASLQKLFLS